MSFLVRAAGWLGSNLVPLVLVPLAALLLWVAIWRVWLPPAAGGDAVARAVTTVDANASTRPTHRVTTVEKRSSGGTPSRRSETVALALIFLGSGTAVVGVFHRRISSLELGRDGIKIELTSAEQHGAAALVARLAGSGAGSRAYARALDRYLHAVSGRRPAAVSATPPGAGLTSEEARAIAEGIAAGLV